MAKLLCKVAVTCLQPYQPREIIPEGPCPHQHLGWSPCFSLPVAMLRDVHFKLMGY